MKFDKRNNLLNTNKDADTPPILIYHLFEEFPNNIEREISTILIELLMLSTIILNKMITNFFNIIFSNDSNIGISEIHGISIIFSLLPLSIQHWIIENFKPIIIKDIFINKDDFYQGKKKYILKL